MRWLALALLVAFVLMLAGCSGMKVEGGCTYERVVTTSYTCQPDSKMEHYRVSPGAEF